MYKRQARYQVEDVSQYWPVYPSFERTMTLLKEQGIEAGTGLAPEKVDRIVIDVQNYFYEQQGELPEGEALAELQKINPNYRAVSYTHLHSHFRLSWTVPAAFCHQGQILSRQPYCRA